MCFCFVLEAQRVIANKNLKSGFDRIYFGQDMAKFVFLYLPDEGLRPKRIFFQINYCLHNGQCVGFSLKKNVSATLDHILRTCPTKRGVQKSFLM